MLLPSRSFSFFDDPFFESAKKESLMNTDIIEKENEYEFRVDLPGFNKEDIKISIENGQLTIHAKNEKNKEEKKEGKIIRQERCFGEVSRSFYIGDNIEADKVNASFEKGVLTLNIPKDNLQKEDKKYIEIK